jgi:hypothetical protein
VTVTRFLLRASRRTFASSASKAPRAAAAAGKHDAAHHHDHHDAHDHHEHHDDLHHEQHHEDAAMRHTQRVAQQRLFGRTVCKIFPYYYCYYLFIYLFCCLKFSLLFFFFVVACGTSKQYGQIRIQSFSSLTGLFRYGTGGLGAAQLRWIFCRHNCLCVCVVHRCACS